MSETPCELSPAMSDQMAWDVVYALALRVAEAHGATVTDAARGVGPYAFIEAVQRLGGSVSLTWAGRLD